MSTKTRIKPVNPTVSRVEAESLVNDIAHAVATKRRLNSHIDQEILAIKDQYASQLRNCDEIIKSRSQLVQIWADANPDEFAKRKSCIFPAGTVGYRTGTPKLSLLSRSWTWEKVLAAVQHILPSFVRNKPEVDKEAILNQRDELTEFLPMVGLKVAQDEAFYIEPDLSAVDPRIRA